MGRLCGCVSWNGRDEAVEWMNRLIARTPGSSELSEWETIEDSRAATVAVLPTGEGYETGTRNSLDDSCRVAFCGYFPQRRKILEDAGYPPDSSIGDAIISLYRSLGPDFLQRLPGMYMLALIDRGDEHLLLASDRNGLFPLYFAVKPSRFLFSSSIIAVKESLGSVGVNGAVLSEYMSFDAIYGSQTFYSDIEVLGYGRSLLVGTGSCSVRRRKYFAYQDMFDISSYCKKRREDVSSELTSYLGNSLRRILDHVKPGDTGLLCGGGIDCSYLAGLLKGMMGGVPIYCSAVSDVDVSEERMVRSVAEKLEVEVVLERMTRAQYYPLLLSCIKEFNQPIAHPNQAKFNAVARLASNAGRRSQIMGAASDLLFGGIENVRSLYRHMILRKYVLRAPLRVRGLISRSLSGWRSMDLSFRMKNPLEAMASIGMGNFERASTQRSIEERLSGIADPVERNVKTLMLENLCDYQQHLLNRRHEIGAMTGLSLFFPFLDEEVVRFAINLPVAYSVNWRTSKLVVRRAARRYLGSDLSKREKWGGGISIEKWIVPLKFLLKDGFVREMFQFRYEELDPVLDRYPKLLWNIVDIELWGRLCVLNHDTAGVLALLNRNGIETSESDPVR